MKTAVTIALYGNSHQDACLEGIRNFMAEARGMGFGLLCHVRFADYLESLGVPQDEIPRRFDGVPSADAAISFGGDGTFLRTARRLGGSPIPVAGVNTGHLGYLAHFSLDEPHRLLDALAEGELKVEERRLIEVHADGLPEDFICHALNEVAVLKDDTASMISTHVEIDGYFLADYQADGLIVSTATGSTAYNLSAGGPILQPSLDCMVVSPVAPHMLTLRPIVVDGKSCLRLTTSSRANCYRLSVDGHSCSLPSGSSVDVCAAPFTVGVLTRPDDTFASTLRDKLLWGKR